MQEYVSYEAFGAAGDGKTDDLPAIAAAHAYANEHGLPVKTKPDAVYYIGGGAVTAVIGTDVDWTTSRFIIDDRAVENRNAPVFLIPPTREPFACAVPPLKRGQTRIAPEALPGGLPDTVWYVTVKSDERKQYIRFGGNQDSGSDQTDSFLLTPAGEILSGINWDYTRITRCEAVPVDETPLTVRGGHFVTVANAAESKYTYFARGISVRRSHVTVENVYHIVVEEGEHGAPYAGFFSFSGCAYGTLKHCHVAGHKIYQTIGSAGTPVPMGSYDINCTGVIDMKILGCRQDDICNRSLWGVFGSNFCKQVTFDGCVLSRTDAHCGVRDYVIRNSVLGWQGTNTIGFGTMLMENVTCFGRSAVGFRADYGSTWDGDLILRNVTWIPQPGTCVSPVLMEAYNREQHDFGYPCTLPHRILIENLTVVDTNTPEGYTGPALFSDFNPDITEENRESHPRPYPLGRPEQVTVRGFRTVSGKPPVLCRNMALFPDTVFTLEDGI